ncbi:hypothetical protein HWV62_16628 [Athelia sp. TMB]|nr:hypothetical protein HWV62_16628 [Athelia sp. TMB]
MLTEPAMTPESTTPAESAMSTKSFSLNKSSLDCPCSAGRNLVVCIDGTSNTYGEKWTNVLELYSRLESKKTQQLRYYQNGIGTGDNSSLGNSLDLAFARHIGTGIKQAYRWLSERYEPGDRIFLFGIMRGKAGALNNCEKHACFVRHALALDERRVKFMPECILQDHQDIPHVKEVWFSGTHSDVGGVHSLSENTAELKNASLSWMENEAISAGLLFKPSSSEWLHSDLLDNPPQNSLKHIWWVVEFLPILRSTRANPGKTTRASFSTVAQPGPWQDFLARGKLDLLGGSIHWHERIEMDLFDMTSASGLVQALQDERISPFMVNHVLRHLEFMASLCGGQQAIAAVPKVRETLQKLLQSLESESATQGAASVVKGQHFLATLRLLAKLSSSYTFAVSTKAAKQLEDLSKWAKDQISSNEVVDALFKHFDPLHVNLEDRFASNTLEDNWEHWAQTITAMAALDDVRSMLLSRDVVSTLLSMLKVRDSRGSAACALVALRVTRKEISNKEQLETTVKSLVEVLPESGGAAAASVLALLSEQSEGSDTNFDSRMQGTILKSPEYRTLKKRCHRSGEYGSTNAAATLNTLGNETQADIKVAFNSVRKLSESLKNSIYGPAALRLAALASDPTKRKEMIDNEMVKALIVRLGMHDPNIAVQVLQKLLCHDDIRQAMITHMSYLFEGVRGFHPGPAGDVLMSLAAYHYDLIINALLGNVMQSEGAPSGVRNEIVDDAAGVLDALLSLGDEAPALARFSVALSQRFLYMLNHFENSTCHNPGAEPSQHIVAESDIDEDVIRSLLKTIEKRGRAATDIFLKLIKKGLIAQSTTFPSSANIFAWQKKFGIVCFNNHV